MAPIGTLAHESPDYRAARAALLEAEARLRDQVEVVAEMRRALPADTVVEDYAVETGPVDLAEDGPIETVPLSSLVAGEERPLVLYHFMMKPGQAEPCPMCAMWIDSWNGVAPHLARIIDLAVCSRAPLAEFRAFARRRGWTNLRLVSSAPSSMARDFEVERPDGSLMPAVSVFRKDEEGRLVRTYSGSADLAQYGNRGLDLLNPAWNILDLTPGGRGDFMPRL